MKKILFNGCSFTAGEGLQEYEMDFSQIINEDPDFETINLAVPGTGNKWIHRETKRALWNPSYDDVTDVFIIWTDFNRVEYVDYSANWITAWKVNFERWGIWQQTSPARVSIAPWRYKKDSWNHFYGEIFKSETGILDTIFYALDIQEMCKAKGINYHDSFFSRPMLMSLSKFLMPKRQEKNSGLAMVNHEFNKLDRHLDVSWKEKENEILIGDMATKYGTCDDMGHPGPEAHKKYAQHVMELI